MKLTMTRLVFTWEPTVTAPNVRTGKGNVVHAGTYGHLYGLSGTKFRVFGLCHARTGTVEAGQWTSDPVTCVNCRINLRRTKNRDQGAGLPIELTLQRLSAWLLFETEVLEPCRQVPVAKRFEPKNFNEAWLIEQTVKQWIAEMSFGDQDAVLHLIRLARVQIDKIFSDPPASAFCAA